jgi:hypothetical protein
MKSLILLALMLISIASCKKNDVQIYSVNLTQSGLNAPNAELLQETKKTFSIQWKRNSTGVYEANIQGIEFSKNSILIDQGNDLNEQIRVYMNNGLVQVYTREWNESFKEWEFSDNVLMKTYLEIKFYK